MSSRIQKSSIVIKTNVDIKNNESFVFDINYNEPPSPTVVSGGGGGWTIDYLKQPITISN